MDMMNDVCVCVCVCHESLTDNMVKSFCSNSVQLHPVRKQQAEILICF